MSNGTNVSSPSLPVMGLPGNMFYVIHFTAIVSLTTSVLFSAGVLTYVGLTKKVPFFKQTIGERLTVYLAFCDLVFSNSHILDHGYMLAILDHVPDDVCIFFAFMLVWTLNAQALLVVLIAILAFVMVVRGKRIKFGRYDWKLLVYAFGVPLVPAASFSIARWLGPSGAW